MESKLFNTEQDEKLIEIVRMHPLLYKPRGKNHKDNIAKEMLWKEIASKLGKTVSECKTRWRTIRDSYKKNKKKLVSQSAVFTKSKYNDEKLKFLDEPLRETSLSNKILKKEKNEDGNNTSETLWTPEGSLIESNLESTSETDNCKEDIGYTDNTKIKRPIKRQCLQAQSECAVPSKMSTKDLKETEQNTPDRKHLNVTKCVLPQRTMHEDQEHPIQTFFRSMATTVMSFPPKLIAETRMKVCSLVSEMELQALSEKSQQT